MDLFIGILVGCFIGALITTVVDHNRLIAYRKENDNLQDTIAELHNRLETQTAPQKHSTRTMWD